MERLRMCSAALVLALAAFVGAADLRAELTWAQKTVELHADSDAAVLEARFRFTNDTASPVDIRDVQSSCGCTTVALQQRHFEPGQGGEIAARFTVGDRVGLQRKTLLVATSEGPVPTQLELIVHIPELLRMQPVFVSWNQGEPPTAKTIEIEALPDAPAPGEMHVQSSSHDLAAELVPAPEGRKYQVRLTPLSTARAFFTTVTVRCRVGTATKTLHAFAAVQVPLKTHVVPPTPAAVAPTVAPTPTPGK